MVHRTRLIGLPGTGKTTRLLELLDELLENYSIDDIIYSSFSNAAVDEAKKRVHKKFGIDCDKMIYFRTLHSMCLYLLREHGIIEGQEVATFKQFYKFYDTSIKEHPDILDELYIHATTSYSYDPLSVDLNFELLDNNPAKFFYNFLQFCSNKYNAPPVSQEFPKHLPAIVKDLRIPKTMIREFLTQIIKISIRWTKFKKEKGLFEFHELLQKILELRIIPISKVLIVDEYQDTSKIQAELIEMWAKGPEMEKVIVAGDPNQAIYGFNGASPHYLEEFPHDEHILLNTSYRVPQNVIEYAQKTLANKWVEKMVSHDPTTGELKIGKFEELEFNEILKSYSSVFILARTSSILKIVGQRLNDLGITSSIPDKLYILYFVYYQIQQKSLISFTMVDSFLKLIRNSTLLPDHVLTMFDEWLAKCNNGSAERNEIEATKFGALFQVKNNYLHYEFKKYLSNRDKAKFDKLVDIGIDPKELREINNKLKLMTIHASKGKEADCVILINGGTYYEFEGEVDVNEEKRIFFVGITRTKKALFVVKVNSFRVKPTRFLPSTQSSGDDEDLMIEIWD